MEEVSEHSSMTKGAGNVEVLKMKPEASGNSRDWDVKDVFTHL